jgi:hypothetical protein
LAAALNSDNQQEAWSNLSSQVSRGAVDGLKGMSEPFFFQRGKKSSISRIFSIEFLNEKEPGAAATRLSQAGFGDPKHRYWYKPGNALPSPISLHK